MCPQKQPKWNSSEIFLTGTNLDIIVIKCVHSNSLGYKSVELTEEQVLKKQQRAKKRRQQAHEKREKDKVCD